MYILPNRATKVLFFLQICKFIGRKFVFFTKKVHPIGAPQLYKINLDFNSYFTTPP
jgi:hypothetical protein